MELPSCVAGSPRTFPCQMRRVDLGRNDRGSVAAHPCYPWFMSCHSQRFGRRLGSKEWCDPKAVPRWWSGLDWNLLLEFQLSPINSSCFVPFLPDPISELLLKQFHGKDMGWAFQSELWVVSWENSSWWNGKVSQETGKNLDGKTRGNWDQTLKCGMVMFIFPAGEGIIHEDNASSWKNVE